MIRSLAVIMAALNATAPNFEPKFAAALLVHRLADDGDFDPLTLIEYVKSESDWDPAAIGARGGYVGLGQIRLANYEPCHTAQGFAFDCPEMVRDLLDWRFNLVETARLFVWSRERCKDTIGSGAFVGWMQTVKGYDATRGTTCGRRRVGRRWVKARVPEKVAELQQQIEQLAKAVAK